MKFILLIIASTLCACNTAHNYTRQNYNSSYRIEDRQATYWAYGESNYRRFHHHRHYHRY